MYRDGEMVLGTSLALFWFGKRRSEQSSYKGRKEPCRCRSRIGGYERGKGIRRAREDEGGEIWQSCIRYLAK